MTTLVGTITPTPIIMTKEPQPNHGDSDKKHNRITEMATAMIVMKIVTIIIGTKIISVNQVLITIHRNALSDTVFNVQCPWHPWLQSASPIVFSLKMV